MDVRRIEEEVDPDFLLDAHSRTGPAETGDSCESKVYTKSKKEYESHLKMNLELRKKEKCHVKPNKMKRKGDCLYDATTGDSCEERHDSRYGLRRDGFALKEDGWSYLGVVIARPSAMWERADVVVDAWSDVRTLIMEEAHVMKYSIHPGVSKM
ncbi:hypothetical protein Tco_0584977 [Tanacetum coccineum]